MLRRRGFALESVVVRVCREAGGRVTTNVLLRDLDFEIADRTDTRRLEVALNGLPLFGGAQLAIDATIVSPFRGDEGLQLKMAWPLQLREEGTNERVLNWWAPEVAHGYSWLVWRLEGVGWTRLRSS